MTTTDNTTRPAYRTPHVSKPYNRPTSSRRSTGSSHSTSFSMPVVESPRTLCPRDEDAFSYKMIFMANWEMSPELSEKLPSALQARITAMQYAGAAVLSGFERLETHDEPLLPINQEQDSKLADSTAGLPPFRLGRPVGDLDHSAIHSSAASMRSEESVYSPTFSPQSPVPGTPAPHEEVTSLSYPASPMSPICLTPPEMNQPRKRERSFCIPLEPNNAYYAIELSHLRTEAVPRLRHAVRNIDTEWYETKRKGLVSEDVIPQFDVWFKEKKLLVQDLYEQVKRKSDAIGLSPNGMGWQAP